MELVSRAQLQFVRKLVRRFEEHNNILQTAAYYQVQYIAIITMLRSIGHVFEKVDCRGNASRSRWAKTAWKDWQTVPVFTNFIEPTRNELLKEFKGGVDVRSGFDTVAVVVNPAMALNDDDMAELQVSFRAEELRDPSGSHVLPQIKEAIDFWDECLASAERAFIDFD
ncbi:hypothetical protein [Aestuariivirga litoralis]|uniref:hypothetical protein n=1 Tax=Aestuariivirga litoralis TaxID=2650924 RepID=UPI0018C64A61|nr:hypothetical protein [Aestuariivirga litoralis]MBG1231084.1 hypothetical protein [Aestuariivirga litoralis]